MRTVKLGRNGQLSLPKDDGVIQLRPAAALPIEMYPPERIAEFERESGIDEVTRDAVREA